MKYSVSFRVIYISFRICKNTLTSGWWAGTNTQTKAVFNVVRITTIKAISQAVIIKIIERLFCLGILVLVNL